jgi:Erg28 like protein
MEYIQLWLYVVASLSLFGSLQGYLSQSVIRDRQFSNAKQEVSPLARRLFGAWTLVATMVRCLAARYIAEEGIYLAAIGTFIAAFGVYTYEVFFSRAVPFKNAIAPFVVAGSTLSWMLIHRYA